MRNRPIVYRGTKSRLTLSERYCPLLLDRNEYQEPTPESRKKRGINHIRNQPVKTSATMLRSALFKIQVLWSKKQAQWKKNTANMTSTRSQSISYLRSGIILPPFDWQNSYSPLGNPFVAQFWSSIFYGYVGDIWTYLDSEHSIGNVICLIEFFEKSLCGSKH